MRSEKADRRGGPLFWLQADPDMPGIQTQYYINSEFDLSDRLRCFLLDTFNVTVVYSFDIVQVMHT